MEPLNLEKFDPNKEALVSMASQFKDIVIAGVADKEGYAKVHEARMRLKNARVNIQKTGKMLRADALAFQKAVIEKEKELIAVIEPTERELEEKQKAVDEEKEKIKRQSLLPARKETLKEIEVVVEDEFLLLMDNTRFTEFVNAKKAEYLEAKEAALQKEKAKMEAEKRRIEEEKEAALREEKHKIEIEQARKEAEEKAKQEMIEQAEREKQQRIMLEKEAADKLSRKKKYQDFLKKNEWTEETKDNFYLLHEGNSVTIFKKLDQIHL